MSWQIIKQPNQQYCIYSTIVDHFIAVNATSQEVKDFYKEERGKQGLHTVEQILEKLTDGKQPYFQFTMTFDEAIQNIKEIHNEFKLEFEDGSILFEKDFYA